MNASDRFLRADESEHYVIGAIVCRAQAFWIAAGTGIAAEHFYSPQLREIFALVKDRSKLPGDWDVLSLSETAPKSLAPIIVDAGFNSIAGSGGVTPNCKTIIAAHIARGVVAAGLRIARIEQPGPVALAEAQSELGAISSGDVGEIEDMRAVMTKVCDGLMRRLDAPESACFGLSTGFPRLDSILGGLMPGITILAARPSMGKTAFALQTCANVSIDSGLNEAAQAKPGSFIGSLEMGSEPLGRRLLAQTGRIPANHLKYPKLLTPEEWPRYTAASKRIKDSKILIWEKSGVSPLQMAGQMRRAASMGNIGLFVVDHIGLLQLDQKNLVHSLGEASMILKRVSMETGIPLLVLCQINRASVDEPQLKDLRDSGKLEENADAVIFVHRKSYYKPGGASSSGIAKIIVAKNRDGESGVMDLYWYGPHQRFYEPTQENYDAEQREEKPAATKYQSNFGARKK